VNMAAKRDELLSGAQWHREWLRLMRRAGVPRPSYHGIHMYHSRTRSAVEAFWTRLAQDWRWQWLGDGPLLVTEASGENLDEAGQIEVMDALWKLYDIGRREGPTSKNGVMGVFWFAAWDGGLWPNCALTEVDPDKAQTMRLTPLGRHWLELKARSNST